MKRRGSIYLATASTPWKRTDKLLNLRLLFLRGQSIFLFCVGESVELLAFNAISKSKEPQIESNKEGSYIITISYAERVF